MTAKPPARREPDALPDGDLVDGRTESRSPKDLRGHREAARIPSMTVADWEAFQADVAENGIQWPLDITEAGVVLDSRHRHRAALALGLPEVPVRVVAPDDEVEFMFRSALFRRHLSAGQRALMVLDRADCRAALAGGTNRKQANLRRSGLDVAVLPHRGRSRAYIADMAGAGQRTVQDAKRLQAHGDEALLERVRAGELSVDKAVREIKRRERYADIHATPLPKGLFDLIYADPAWPLASAEQHYPLMPIPGIAALAIPAADNAALFMWAVTSLLPEALRVIEAWGFTYKSAFVWVKPSIGPGNYVRNRHELLLIATRGNYPTPQPKHRPDSVIEAPRGRHSEKPKVVYELMEQMYPTATRLELFARGKPRPGWTAWGNQVTT